MSTQTQPQLETEILPRPESLHDDLLLLDGAINEEGFYHGKKFNMYSQEQMHEIANAVYDWLPNRLEEHGVTPSQVIEAEPFFTFGKDPDSGEEWASYFLYQTYNILEEGWHLPEGKIIEVAGPTEGDRSMEAMYGVRPDLVMNLIYEPEKRGYTGPVDAAADARELPLVDESVAGIFISCLPGALRERSMNGPDLRPRAITEAIRVLKPDGRLFWNGGTQADLDEMLENGLIPEYISNEIVINEDLDDGHYTVPQYSIDGIFRKASSS